ncbi:MAG: energy coupling factor transporter S component ThiW [Leuconostoc fallax]
MHKNVNTSAQRIKKMVVAALLSGLSYALSTMITFPNMAPFQHFVDVIAAILLGPWYATLSGLITGVARMSFEARPATSVVSILVAPALAAWLYRLTGKIWGAVLGEIVGVGVIGALLSYPVMKYIYGLDLKHFYYYMPFFIPSVVVGSILGGLMMYTFKKSGQLKRWQKLLNHQ